MLLVQSYVAEDGVYHMVAKPDIMEAALLAEQELEKARVLSKTSWVWSERIKYATYPLATQLWVVTVNVIATITVLAIKVHSSSC